MRGEYWIPKQESMISAWEKASVISALMSGYSVVIDATNLNPKYIDEWKKISKLHNAPIEYKDFLDVSVATCIERDKKRANSVGEKVIRGMYEKYLKTSIPKYKPNALSPKAFIFDIDGTLARMNDRSPYDWNKVNDDTVIKQVNSVLLALSVQGYHIIIFSGRDGSCEGATKKWLSDNGIPYNYFDIRPEGDTRKDSIIKQEMFDKIKDKYNVIGVFDDRDQVVRMWRDLGLQCFQCNYGEF